MVVLRYLYRGRREAEMGVSLRAKEFGEFGTRIASTQPALSSTHLVSSHVEEGDHLGRIADDFGPSWRPLVAGVDNLETG